MFLQGVKPAYGQASHPLIFPTVHIVKTHFLLENLSISEPGLGVLEIFQQLSLTQNIIVQFYFQNKCIGC